ncbi:MAG: hypothetical protein GDA51_13290 [Ekhidna sp.]|nr:hypothetical protein [Ekhidna sp.]MBC6427407.1 hypothetical protein [Ekhidna sp.]
MKELSLEKMEKVEGGGVCAYASVAMMFGAWAIPGLGYAAAATTLVCAAIEIADDLPERSYQAQSSANVQRPTMR